MGNLDITPSTDVYSAAADSFIVDSTLSGPITASIPASALVGNEKVRWEIEALKGRDNDAAYGSVNVTQGAPVAGEGVGKEDGSFGNKIVVETALGANLVFDPVPPKHSPKKYTRGMGTVNIDVYTKNPRLGYRITGSLLRDGVWIPFKNKIVQMDDIDMIRQEYVNHYGRGSTGNCKGIDIGNIKVPIRADIIEIPAISAPFKEGNWSESSYGLMLNGNMQKRAKEVNKLYAGVRDQYTTTSPLLDLTGNAMPVITTGLRLSGGWRNPERNEYYSSCINSKHQLGNALDLAPEHAIMQKTATARKQRAAFYWLLWKSMGTFSGTAQLENTSSIRINDFTVDKKPKNGIPDGYENAGHLHIQ